MTKILTYIIVILLITSCKFSQHTREMWDDVPRVKTNYKYITNTIRCKFIDEKRIAVWLEDNNYGKENWDKNMPDCIRKSCAIFQFDEDMTKMKSKVKKIDIYEVVNIDKHSEYVQFRGFPINIQFEDNHKIGCRLVEGRLILPDKDTKILSNENICYTKEIVISKKNYRDPVVAGYIAVTPVTVSMDIVEASLIVGTSPIWFPYLVWAFHDFQNNR